MKSKCIVPEYLPSKPVVEKKRDNFYPEGTVYVKLRNGIQMPVVASGVPGSDFVANTKIILDAKVAHIDTAYQYGNQHGIGLGLKGYNRTSYFLTTKIPECGSNDLKDTSHCGKQSTKLMEQNLQELDVEYVDLMLVHRPPHGIVQDQWRAVEEFYYAGKTRAIGVSNYCQECFDCLKATQRVVPMVNQVEYHVGMGSDPHELLSYSASHGIVIEAYSPLGGSSGKAIHNDRVVSLANDYQKSSAQIALKWILQQNSTFVTASANEKYLQEDLDVFDFNISLSDMEKLDAETSPGGSICQDKISMLSPAVAAIIVTIITLFCFAIGFVTYYRCVRKSRTHEEVSMDEFSSVKKADSENTGGFEAVQQTGEVWEENDRESIGSTHERKSEVAEPIHSC
eukprot:jgi/Bigna1/52343/estExt_Genewise1Plus.C_70108